jgi:hypothetical protein
MLYGVEQGYRLNNLERNVELDNRIFNRNVPSAPLQANFSMRPVSTKYDLMGVFDRREPATEPIIHYSTYNTSQVFNPGTAQAPWSGFASNINTESSLRNQFFALQSCDQSHYIPSTKSELYEKKIAESSNKLPNEFHYLQRKPIFKPFNPNPYNLGQGIMMNHTRQQLKDLDKLVD